jgi:hypothetical protein
VDPSGNVICGVIGSATGTSTAPPPPALPGPTGDDETGYEFFGSGGVTSSVTYGALSAAGVAIKLAYRTLNARLANDPTCLNWLESGIAGGISSDFWAYPSGAEQNTRQGTITAGNVDINGSYNSSTGLVVSTNGAFFNPAVGVGYYQAANPVTISFLQGGTLPAQVFILLHELAHYFQADGFINMDGSQGASAANNDLLLKKCAKTIQAPIA